MVKPFTARELLARVSAHITLGRVRREAVERERALRAELELRVEERTQELQRANRELRELTSRLQQVRDDEHRRLARDLHDSAGQLLAAMSFNVGAIQKRSEPISVRRWPSAWKIPAHLIRQLTSEIRTVSHLLHPPLLDEVGLSSALRWYVEGFAERSKIKATLDLPRDLARLPEDVEIAVFRAVQECLTNVHRHAHSPSCAISVRQDEGRLRIEIRDAGQGIPQEKQARLASSGSGVGLRGLRERLLHLGGTLEIDSSPSGTTVVVSVPVQPTSETQSASAN